MAAAADGRSSPELERLSLALVNAIDRQKNATLSINVRNAHEDLRGYLLAQLPLQDDPNDDAAAQ